MYTLNTQSIQITYTYHIHMLHTNITHYRLIHTLVTIIPLFSMSSPGLFGPTGARGVVQDVVESETSNPIL